MRARAEPDVRGEAFHRDSPTLLSYGVVAGYAFWLYAFGPALALLRAELHFSYTLLGIYSALIGACALLTRAPTTAPRRWRTSSATCSAG